MMHVIPATLAVALLPCPEDFEDEILPFDLLPPDAQSRAIDNARYEDLSHEWWDSTYEDFCAVARVLGFSINEDVRTNQKGYRYTEKSVCFSGFSSQGDGACFAARWAIPEDPEKKMHEYAGLDTRLHGFATEVARISKMRPRAEISAKITIDRRFSHSGAMELILYCEDPEQDNEFAATCYETLYPQSAVADMERDLQTVARSLAD
jgi:hypothetical protein